MDYDQLPDNPSIPQEQIPSDTSSGGFSLFSMNFLGYGFWKKLFTVGILICVTIFVYIFIIMLPPSSFLPESVTVSPGSSVRGVGVILKEKKVIKSTTLFSVCSRLVAKKGTIATGSYLFESPESVCRVAYRMSRGIYGSSQIKITIPEGSTNTEIAEIVFQKYPTFDDKQFIKSTQNLQGYLFPDTYFFFKGFTTDQLLEKLQKTFSEKTNTVFAGVSDSQKKQIVIMASILEREASNADEAKVISGILWKRIEIGMPLQVDATLKYTTGRGSNKLTLDDLQKDGPYNTYTRTGLPAGPIGNPGLAMITAAMNPEKSPYLYYLHDSSGKIYYAKSHDEHVRNKNKYLK